MRRMLFLVILTAVMVGGAALAQAQTQTRYEGSSQYPRESGWMNMDARFGTDAVARTAGGLRGASPSLVVNFAAVADNGAAPPPNTMGAVGPNHLLVMLNTEVAVQTRTGSVLSKVGLDAFWQGGLSVIDVFSPKVLYDATAGRFIAMSATGRDSADAAVLLAVSATSDPTGDWYMWSFDVDATDLNWADFCSLGVSGDFVTLSANKYAISDGSYLGVDIWAVDKVQALAGAASPVTTKFELEAAAVGGTIVPCQTMDTGVAEQYLVNTADPATGKLRVHILATDTGGPTFTSTEFFPTSDSWSNDMPGAPQLGHEHLIETNNSRMLSAVYRGGEIWCAHAVGLPTAAPDHTAAKWWRIDYASRTVVDWGVIDDYAASGMFYYYPSIAVNVNGDALVGMSGSSATTYAGAYYAFRTASDPAGTMRATQILKQGEAPYVKICCDNKNRWGNYSATCVDPVDDVSMWTIQEYAESPVAEESRWGTWWGEIDTQRTSWPTCPVATSSCLLLLHN